MYYVKVDIEHPDGTWDSYGEYFDSFDEAKRYAKSEDNGDPGDKVKIYIDDVLWKEYTV